MANLGGSYQPSVMQLAQEGDFRAIAYWLNICLVPQGIYAWVSAAKPGYLQIVIDFERAPARDRVIRFVCHRLCKLNSPLIQGVQIIARRINTSHLLWTQAVRIRKSGPRPAPRSPLMLPPARSHAIRKPRKPNRIRRRSTRDRQRAASLLLSGSAAAAFLIGCGIEIFSQNTAASASRQPKSILTSGNSNTEPATVKTALETVPVSQQPVLNPLNQTVTMAFTSGSALSPTSSTLVRSNYESVLDTYQNADVVLTSLEAPLSLTASASSSDTSGMLQVLQDNSVDLVNLANQRILDEGRNGLSKTLNALEQVGIYSIGAGRNQREARRPEILDVKGQRIAYLGYSDSDLNAAATHKAGLNANPTDRIATDIKAIRNQVDWVVVNYHWNQDLAAYPTDWQMNLAHLAIDEGADLVIGHHPNVLQGAEIYKGRAIAYSLGNFIFADGASDLPTENYDTAVLKVSLRQEQMRLEFLPIAVTQSNPEVATGQKGEQILTYIQQASGLFETPMQSPVVLDKRSPNTDHRSQPAPAAEPPFSPAPSSDSFVTYPEKTGETTDTPEASDLFEQVESGDPGHSDFVAPSPSYEPAPPYSEEPEKTHSFDPVESMDEPPNSSFIDDPAGAEPFTTPYDAAPEPFVDPQANAAPSWMGDRVPKADKTQELAAVTELEVAPTLANPLPQKAPVKENFSLQ